MEKFTHLSKKMKDSISELRSWLPNYDHGEGSFPDLINRLLASLPGGERMEDYAKPFDSIGWGEVQQLTSMLDAIENKEDVEALCAALLADKVTMTRSSLNVYEEEEEIPKREEKDQI